MTAPYFIQSVNSGFWFFLKLFSSNDLMLHPTLAINFQDHRLGLVISSNFNASTVSYRRRNSPTSKCNHILCFFIWWYRWLSCYCGKPVPPLGHSSYLLSPYSRPETIHSNSTPSHIIKKFSTLHKNSYQYPNMLRLFSFL